MRGLKNAFSCALRLCYTDHKISVFPFSLETKLFLHFRFYADWQPAGQHGYSIQVCLQLPERTLALPKVYLNNLHTSHIPHLNIDDDIYNHLLDEDHRRPFGRCQGPCQDDHVLVKDQPKSDDHSLDEDHQTCPGLCQRVAVEVLKIRPSSSLRSS